MSLEQYGDELKNKFVHNGSIGFGKNSVHEHASGQLLHPYNTVQEEMPDGTVKTTKELDIEGRTILPSPANSTIFHVYASWYETAFGKRKNNFLMKIDETYMKRMPSKNGKSRDQFVAVAAASALNPDNSDESVLEKVQKS